MEERYAFVVRIWVQRASPSQHARQLRGTLQSTGPGPPRYFSSLAQLTQLLAAMLEAPVDLPSSYPPAGAGHDDAGA